MVEYMYFKLFLTGSPISSTYSASKFALHVSERTTESSIVLTIIIIDNIVGKMNALVGIQGEFRVK